MSSRWATQAVRELTISYPHITFSGLLPRCRRRWLARPLLSVVPVVAPVVVSFASVAAVHVAPAVKSVASLTIGIMPPPATRV